MDDDLNRNHALDASASDASRRTESSGPGRSGDQERTQAFLDDWRAATTPSTGNRRVLSLDGHPAVEIGMRTAPGGAVWLEHLYAFDPGRGRGGRALEWIVSLADRHRVPVVGTALAFGHGLAQRELEAWFERRGFRVGEKGRLERRPRAGGGAA
jgi:hypothetical protein